MNRTSDEIQRFLFYIYLIKYNNNLPYSMGNVLLKNNDIDIFLNNDATYFETDNGQSTLYFNPPLSPLFALHEGFTLIRKTNNGSISKFMFKLQLQLNTSGEPVVPIKPPLK